MVDYREFLDSKTSFNAGGGISNPSFNSYMFDFQKDLVEWALYRGRSAIFADCALGKTLMELSWAENVVKHTGKKVLILAPLAVSYQTIREAEKFGFMDIARSEDGTAKAPITITNYEKLEKFNASDFAGMVCDESSIMKSFNGIRKGEITRFMRKLPYRLLCTATAAPNDYTELGTSSEALGYLGYMDMLNRFFRNANNTSDIGRYRGKKMEWRLKGHAELPFWRWICSWARALRKPSDLGYDDTNFILKPLIEEEHKVRANSVPNGRLFEIHAMNLEEQREERKRTIPERCEKVAELVSHGKPALVWCHLNEEGRMLREMIKDSVEVSGADKDESKEAKFMDFVNGKTRVLITKPKIGGWGLNFQHCAHVVIFPTHSFEQYYQAVRRCWRFGQLQQVKVDVVLTEGEQKVFENLHNKAEKADEMFTRLVELMSRGEDIKTKNEFTQKEVVPSWL